MYDNDTLQDIQVSKVAQRSLLSRSFVYMFFGLLLTAAVAAGLGFLFLNLYNNAASSAAQSSVVTAINAVTISSAIVLIIMTFVISLVFLKGKHSLVVPSILYAVVMGCLLSSFVVIFKDNWYILAEAFAISAGAFGVMALIGIFTKGNLSMLGIIACGIIFGAAIICLVNLILGLTGHFVPTLHWIVEFAIFGAMILITIFDINRIKEISQQGEYTTNLALYCAITLYTDFIYIFVKIVYFLALANRN